MRGASDSEGAPHDSPAAWHSHFVSGSSAMRPTGTLHHLPHAPHSTHPSSTLRLPSLPFLGLFLLLWLPGGSCAARGWTTSTPF
eukprot:411069-Pyramimonas_sp.AAC.1